MKRLVLMAVVFAAAGALAAGAWGYFLIERPYKGYADAETFVDIVPGSNPQSMGRVLADAGVVADVTAFRIAVWLEGAGRRLQAGEYRFDAPMTPRAVVDKIARGDVFLRPVTFREGLTIREMAVIFEEKGFGPQAEFVAAASKPGPFASSIRRPRISRVISFPTPTRCRAARPRPSSSSAWSRASRRR